MEAFSLLKYWRGARGGGNACVAARSVASAAGGSTTTIVTAVTNNQVVDTDDENEDDGPFFDLEFAVSDGCETEENKDIEEEGGIVEEEEEENEDQNEGVDAKSDDGCSDGDPEFNFTLSSGSSNDPSDPNLAVSPSDDLFFKGRLVPIETDSCLESKPPQFPVSLLKSATKFRVFLLRFKKSKLNSTEKTESASANGPASVPTGVNPRRQETIEEENNSKKLFAVKFKVEEVPIMSLLSRDNNKSQKQQSSEETVSDEKKFSKDAMQKYLKKVKPLYVRVSRRYGEKLKFSGQLNLGSLKPVRPQSMAAPKSAPGKVTTAEAEVGKNPMQGNIHAGIRVVCKHLGKSRSASSAVAAVPPALAVSKRRDDSLLQQEDGIQGAILHCKRSFNGCLDSSTLPRSVSVNL